MLDLHTSLICLHTPGHNNFSNREEGSLVGVFKMTWCRACGDKAVTAEGSVTFKPGAEVGPDPGGSNAKVCDAFGCDLAQVKYSQ